MSGLQNNIGDLTNYFITQRNPDIAMIEPFFTQSLSTLDTYIQEYSRLHRRALARGTFGGVGVCFREGLAIEALDVDIEEHLEMMFLRLWTSRRDFIQLCAYYRLQWHGGYLIHFLHPKRNTLLF